MANVTTLGAEVRQRAGKGAARQTRRDGRVPAIIYGDKQDSVMISIDPLELDKQLRGPGFFARVFEVNVNGEKHRVLARDLQVDPVSDRPIHVDFMRFSATMRLNVDVEILFENEAESPGIKRGGVLNVVRHAVELNCAADNIPESLAVDLTGLDIGDSMHASVLTLPEGVELTITDRDFTIATIAAPTIMEEPEVEAAEDEAAVEGEVAVEGEEEAKEGEEEAKEGDGAGEDKE